MTHTYELESQPFVKDLKYINDSWDLLDPASSQ